MQVLAFASLTIWCLAKADAFVNIPKAFCGTKVNPSTGLQATPKEDLLGAQEMIDKIIYEKACGPILVRLAWHDSGTFDVNIKEEWPAAGGAIGSIRFEPEINHGANAGLANALKLLEPVKEAYPAISYADIFQMASARAIETSGGPTIGVKYGRVDATSPEQCSPEGNLPDAEPDASGKYGGPGGTASTESTEPEGHLRKVFYRMGLNDEDIVALSGAHTFGRAYKDRSGAVKKEITKYTDGSIKQPRADGTDAPFTPGGQSWTDKFLIFDNSFFKIMDDPNADEDLLKMSSDLALFKDDGFRPFAEKFRDDQEAFFASYARAHKKLSELGSKFVPAEGITV